MDFALANLNWVEAMWILVSVAGLYFGWGNLQHAKRDREKAEEVRNGLRPARIVVANGYVYRNRIRVAIFTWWVFLGVMFGFFDPPDIPRIGGLLGLIATAAGFAFVGAQENAERRALAAIVAHQGYADTLVEAEDTVKRRAEIAAAELEMVAVEAALRLRQLAKVDDGNMAIDQRRSADAAERTADSIEGMLQDAADEDA